jgi:tetratricopeptide (TPR) repeat protein
VTWVKTSGAWIKELKLSAVDVPREIGYSRRERRGPVEILAFQLPQFMTLLWPSSTHNKRLPPNTTTNNSMTSSTALFAISLNNEGVSQLEAANYGAAATSFSRALFTVKQALASGHFEEAASKPLESEADTEAASPTCQFRKLHGNECGMETDEVELKEPIYDQKGFVFEESIFLLPKEVDTADYAFFVKLSFVHLYNLALSHHLCALQATDPEPFLRKALALYELAYTIHVSEDIEITILQSMAIVNNIGHLHQQLNNIDKSRECFEHLLSTLMFVKDTSCGEQDHQLDGFLSNVLLLMLNNCTPAPAA